MKKIFRIILKDKKLIILVIVLLFFLLLWIAFLIFYNKDVSITSSDGSINIKNPLELFANKANEADNDVKLMKETLSKLTKPELIDSLCTLIKIREGDAKKFRSLAERFENLKDLSPHQEQELADEIAAILAKDKNLEVINYAFTAKSLENMENEKQIGSLEADVRVYKNRIDSLIKLNRLQKRKLQEVAIAYNKLKKSYNDANTLIENLNQVISVLKKDTLNNRSAIALLNNMVSELNDKNSKLDSVIKSTKPIRVDEIVFIPSNTKKRKVGTYKLHNVKEIELSFKLSSNLDLEEKQSNIKIILFIPNKRDGSISRSILDTTIRFGQVVKLSFNKLDFKKDSEFDFGTGRYNVQFIDPNIENDKAIEKEYFDVQ